MSEANPLPDVVENAVDQVATKVEEIHRAVADAPITMLERLGLLESSAQDLREVHHNVIGVVYDLVRDINHSVHDLTRDLPRALDEGDAAEA